MKKTTRVIRKLHLQPETIRQLTKLEQVEVVGGSGTGNSDCLSTRVCNQCAAMD